MSIKGMVFLMQKSPRELAITRGLFWGFNYGSPKQEIGVV